jgi:hypothetical protein
MALTRMAISRTIKATAMSANWRQQYIRRTPAVSGPRPLTELQPDGGIAGPLHRVVLSNETE